VVIIIEIAIPVWAWATVPLCEHVGIYYCTTIPECKMNLAVCGIGTSKNGGAISRVSWNLYCRGNQKKKSPAPTCSNRVYWKNNSLHQRPHNGRAWNSFRAESHINMNPSPCNQKILTSNWQTQHPTAVRRLSIAWVKRIRCKGRSAINCSVLST
jgi:hypothetical protein